MKKILVTAVSVLILSGMLYAHNKKLATETIQNAEAKIADIEKLDDIKQFIPYKLYSEGLMNIVNAKTSLAQNNFGRSYYLASIAYIQLDCSVIQAETNKIVLAGGSIKPSGTDDKKTIPDGSTPDPGKKIVPDGTGPVPDSSKTSSLIERAGLEKKQSVYVRSINDDEIFHADGFTVNTNGKNILNRVIDLMKENPESKITVISHLHRRDNHGIGLRKSDAVRSFISGRGINAGRITTISSGSREVVKSGSGFRRIDRIEIIISGID
jgi:outer membrane protein OmpA-like peptidoglycan-associated protein